MQLKSYSFDLEFEYPFTIAKGTKTHQPTLIVSLGVGPRLVGFGEATAISYYNVTVEHMQAVLDEKRGMIERYALTDPMRFWHFLHHLIPGENFLIAALDIAGWDLFAQIRRMPLYRLLQMNFTKLPVTDYTLGIDTPEKMVAKMQAHPWPMYKIKIGKADDIDLIRTLRGHTEAPFRVDANEALAFDDAKKLLPELKELGVTFLEQPLAKTEWDAMKELKQLSSIPLFADESCVEEHDVAKCVDAFHGINIKLTKCGGITPAIRMIGEARKTGLKVMMGSMNESTIGAAAVANMAPVLDEMDIDGPLLLKENVAEGLTYDNGVVKISGREGLGIRFWGEKKLSR
ncbi:dipeptide epimerase [Taibaiella soli]|uniref:Dipeptide epimerase n=1 Tax=Taibaiella soli TaxID=1649169 RepID=A0A2W2AL49_9BACT|nr:dipeptide epimerase [Taibaiella soli]